MYNVRDKIVLHILRECEKLAQGEYKKRHDHVALLIHCELSEIPTVQKSKNWFEHRA